MANWCLIWSNCVSFLALPGDAGHYPVAQVMGNGGKNLMAQDLMPQVMGNGGKNFKKQQCQLCGLWCFNSGSLTRHLRTHTGERPHTCTICYKKFSQKCNLNSHMKKVHKTLS